MEDNRIKLTKLTEKISEIVKEASRIILNADRSGSYINEKEGHANFVTLYDTKVQSFLKDKLKTLLPDAEFIGEEGESDAFDGKGYAFIVDPIDGTTNFIRNYGQSVISVGLTLDGERAVGVIYDPYQDKLYTAVKGCGAFCNGRRIQVSNRPLEQGIVFFGTAPYYEELAEPTFKTAYGLFRKCLDVRCGGSSALALCKIAEGGAEMYFELRLSPWDYAAGSLIIEEAGGRITGLKGEPLEVSHAMGILATNGRISPSVLGEFIQS